MMTETFDRLVRIEETLGNETILDALLDWITDDQLNEFLDDIEKDYDLNEEKEEGDE